MKRRFTFAAIVIAAAASALAALPMQAFADRGGGRYGGHYGGHYRYPGWGHGYYPGFRVYIGPAYPFYPYAYWGPYYYPPYYYPPAVVTAPASPPVYIEKGGNAAQAPDQPQAYWYYCAASNAYYPYVKECPGGWQRQTPMPPPDTR